MRPRVLWWLNRLAISLVIPCPLAFAQPPASPERVRSAPRVSPAWNEIARTPQTTAYLDTARIEWRPDGRERLWLRVRYTTPMPPSTHSSPADSVIESRVELDCAARRVSELIRRVASTTGASAAKRVVAPQWRSIDREALESTVFLAACRALGAPIDARPDGKPGLPLTPRPGYRAQHVFWRGRRAADTRYVRRLGRLSFSEYAAPSPAEAYS